MQSEWSVNVLQQYIMIVHGFRTSVEVTSIYRTKSLLTHWNLSNTEVVIFQRSQKYHIELECPQPHFLAPLGPVFVSWVGACE